MDSILNSNVIGVAPISIVDSLISLFLASLFGWLIARIYKFSSESIYGGRQVASSIIPLSLTVCLIITVVKSSLALSLGLVGALSIVRFRTPIKDPEDLVYLFLALVNGLGFGANQNLYTSLGISFILLFLSSRSFLRSRKKLSLRHSEDYTLNIESSSQNEVNISEIIDLLASVCLKVSVLRYEKSREKLNLLMQINLLRSTEIDSLIKKISKLNPNYNIQIYGDSIES